MVKSTFIMEDIASAIAHEVKNPLTLVKANIDILEAKDEHKDNKKNYKMIRSELNKINDIITDFINLVQPESENKEFLDIIYIADILSSIVEENSISYEGKIKFFLSYTNYDLCILGKEKNITMMFNNIVKNAIEAIENEGIITINIYEDDNNVVIKIKDNGIGIKKDIEERIYEKFFTTKETGTGLGVPICYKIATDHNGIFKLENNDIGGCTATVFLPKYN